MSQKQYAAVDDYIVERLDLDDAALKGALKANAAAGLPAIDVPPAQGKFLHLLAKMIQARRILEIGTLGGYSAIWLARALPKDGRLVTLEFDPRHAAAAKANIERAGLGARVSLHVGAALETLPKLAGADGGPFDLVFIDADKANNANYVDWGVRLARPGAVIICDNVVRDGHVVDAKSRDAGVMGARGAFDAMRSHPKLSATALQTVGAKGWDGFLMAVVE